MSTNNFDNLEWLLSFDIDKAVRMMNKKLPPFPTHGSSIEAPRKTLRLSSAEHKRLEALSWKTGMSQQDIMRRGTLAMMDAIELKAARLLMDNELKHTEKE